MSYSTLGLLVVAIVAAVLGFGFIVGTAAWLARSCLVAFLILAVLAYLKTPRQPGKA